MHAPRRFLPEVQALRALAVTLVVAYHLYPAAVPGGFVGVDVFFVISGFLITSHLLREVEKRGRISLPAFWAARVRRIMPAALVTIAAISAATLAFWPSTQWAQISRQGLASVLSVENWALAFDAVDYLSADNAPTAFQHFWSLGVEEQFYVLWPLVVLLAGTLAGWGARARHRRNGDSGLRSGRRSAARGVAGPPAPRVRLWAAWLFALTLLASFVYAVVLVKNGDPIAYFATTTRVWELAAGGLLAAVLPAAGWGARAGLRNAVALLGVATLVAVAMLYTAQTPFPGLGALPPVLGTLAIIAAGEGRGPGSLRALVEWRPVQWVGDVSYSLYLWHWPVVIVFLQLAGHKPRWWQALGLLALSLALAAASYYLVERPARRWKFTAQHTWRALGVGALATALVAGVALVPTVRADAVAAQQQRDAAALLASPPPGFGAAAWAEDGGAAWVAGTTLVPAPEVAAKDKAELGECFAAWDAPETPRCSFGPEGAQRTIALVGDSHAEQWFTPLHEMAKAKGWRLLTFVKEACPFTATKRILERDSKLVCTDANARTLRTLEEAKPDVVVTAAFSGFTYAGDPQKGFEQYYRSLLQANIPVVVMRDTPLPALPAEQRPRDCVAAAMQAGRDVASCSTPADTALRPDPAAAAALAVGGGSADAAGTAGSGSGSPSGRAGGGGGQISVIDLSQQFCDRSTCPAVLGNVLVYRDANHVSDTFLRTLLPEFERRFASAAGTAAW